MGSYDDVRTVWILSGSIPREIIRLADVVLEARTSHGQWYRAALALAAREAWEVDKDFARSSYDFASGREGERLLICRNVIRRLESWEQPSQPTFLDDWTPADVSSAWTNFFLETYRRLLVRLTIAQTVKSVRMGARQEVELRDAAIGAASSAELGRDTLLSVLSYLGIPGPVSGE